MARLDAFAAAHGEEEQLSADEAIRAAMQPDRGIVLRYLGPMTPDEGGVVPSSADEAAQSGRSPDGSIVLRRARPTEQGSATSPPPPAPPPQPGSLSSPEPDAASDAPPPSLPAQPPPMSDAGPQDPPPSAAPPPPFPRFAPAPDPAFDDWDVTPFGLKLQREAEKLAAAKPDTAPQSPAPAEPPPTLTDRMRGWVENWRPDLYWTSWGRDAIRGIAGLIDKANGNYVPGDNLSDDELLALSLLAMPGTIVPRAAGTLRSVPVGPIRPGVTRAAKAAGSDVAKAAPRAEPEAVPSLGTAEPTPSATSGPSVASGEGSVAESASAPRAGATAAEPAWKSNPYLAEETPLAGGKKVGIRRARRLEVELVRKTGKGTLEGGWSAPEIEYITRTGKLPNGIIGHHINNVARYPEWAGDPRNIEFYRSADAHLGAHARNFQNSTTGPLIDRAAKLREARGGQ